MDAGPPTTELRIDAVEAAVAAGLAPQQPTPPVAEDPEPTGSFELPAWTDPPTGQIPRVLLDDPDATVDEPSMPKPTWRQGRAGWQEESIDLAFLLPEEDEPTAAADVIAGRVAPEEAPFEFVGLDEPTIAMPQVDADPGALDEDAATWDDVLAEPPSSRRRHATSHAHHRKMARRERRQTPVVGTIARAGRAPGARNATVAIATGIGLGVLAALCLLGGAAPTDGLVAVLGAVAAGEFFGVLQRTGHRPATLVGLVAVPVAIVTAYLAGPAGLALTVALAFAATGAWFLRASASAEPLVDAAITSFVVTWVGVLGGCAGLLLAPSAHPDRHGVALVFGVIACTVAHDVGAYAVGSRLGKRKIAPRVSPGKTVEGLLGGTVLDLFVAGLVVARIHPFSIKTALVLGVVVAVFAPLGDLIESSIKRDLGVKDMGSILPAHGGVFDRVDAMLMAMPAAYILFRIANVG